MTVALVRSGPRFQAAIAVPAFHHWLSPEGAVWAEFFRVPEGYLVRSLGVGDFLVSPDGATCEAWPVPDVSDETVEHVYRNTVFPLARSQQRAWMLHAAAVEIGDDCVLFAGPAGRGKSTLSTFFALSGHRFLADDAVQVVFEGARPEIVPGHASVRLWPDSHRALLEGVRPSSETQLNDKARFIAGGRLTHSTQARPLARVYLLLPSDGDDVKIAVMRDADPLIALINNSFVLDVDAAPILRAHFDTMARLAQLPLFFTLAYPRRFERLGDVREAVLAHCTKT